MSLEDRVEEAAQERFLIVPITQFEKAKDTVPVSNRMYAQLEPVQVDAVKRAAAMADNEESVIAPMGAMVHLGRTLEEVGGYIVDDVAVVPRGIDGCEFGSIQLYNQIPNMIDDKPPEEHDGEKEIDFGRLPTFKDYNDSVQGQEKPVEQVLATSAQSLIAHMLSAGEHGDPMSVQDSIYMNLSFIRRGWCETDTRFVQFLPYITFYKKSAEGLKLFVYQRGKGVGEERLALNCSVGAGGHINPIDFLSMQTRLEKHPDQTDAVATFTGRMFSEAFWEGIMSNVFREGREEVKIRQRIDQPGMEKHVFKDVDLEHYICHCANAEGLAVDQWLHDRTSFFLDYASGDVEKVHLGMFIAIEVPEDFMIETAEECLHDVGFVSLDDLYCAEGAPEAPWSTPTPLECWSRSIVNALYETKKFISDNKVEFKANSDFMRRQLINSGSHLVSSEVVAKIPAADRWKIGTISASFGPEYRFYAMNAFLRA